MTAWPLLTPCEASAVSPRPFVSLSLITAGVIGSVNRKSAKFACQSKPLGMQKSCKLQQLRLAGAVIQPDHNQCVVLPAKFTPVS